MCTIKFINLNINPFYETDDSIREALSERLIEAGLSDPNNPNKPIENISDKLMLEISGQIPDVLFIIERKETSETDTIDTIVTTYYRDGKPAQLAAGQLPNIYHDQLREQFIEPLDFKNNVTEIPGQMGQKLFLIYRETYDEALLIRLSPAEYDGLKSNQDAVLNCPDRKTYLSLVDMLNSVVNTLS